jgi:hypothetical protein
MLVKLNVGGTIYWTTEETLTNRGFNMLSSMVSHSNPAQLVDGAYFIDRDPVPFRWLLNYLRGSNILPPRTSPELWLLREEAEYFSVDGLCRSIQHILEPEFKIGDHIKCKDNKVTVVSVDGKGYIVTKLGQKYKISASEDIVLVNIEVGDTVEAYVAKSGRAPGLCMSIKGKMYAIQMDGQETQYSLPASAIRF